MVRRRRDIEILVEVLSLCRSGVRVTQLMYRANLSYSTLRRYLRICLEKGLVRNERCGEGYMVYYSTDKGKALLEMLREVAKTLSG